MFRKTLTILSLIALLLSVGSWGVSYLDISYTWVSVETDVANERTEWYLSFGGFGSYQTTTEASLSTRLGDGFRVEGFDGFATDWLPPLSVAMWSPGMFIPLWIPTLLFAALFLSCRPFHFHRRRKRKKLGLCLKCGYNLKGLTESRCPECGTSFGETMMFSRRRVFVPRFSGELEFRALPPDLMATLESRIQEGFLVRGSRARSNYRISSSSNDSVTISADDWWTAINIGLNEVKLRREDDQRITFEVSFWRWTTYAAMLGMLIFVVLLGACVFTDWMRPWLSQNRLETLGACSVGIFFCLCWPWILTEFHKKPAARCLERILHETFTDAA